MLGKTLPKGEIIMKWNNWIPIWVVGFFAALVGMTYLAGDVVHAQSASTPQHRRVERFEFPQDGVVCYRYNAPYNPNAPMSCVKK
jgi:hypothetical protein